MLRVYHNQTVQGGILIDDIDDGLPNKTVYRLGSTADRHAYKRDGYANSSKQACYVPFSHTVPSGVGGGTVAGYITLNQTNRVISSFGKGKLLKLQTLGLITIVQTTAAALAAPVITASVHATALSGTVGVTLGSNSVPTTASQVGVVAVGATVTFAAQAGVAYTASAVTATTITLTTNYTGTTNASTTATLSYSITGTAVGSVAPDVTTVTLAQGTGGSAPAPLTLTTSQIVTAGGTVSGSLISIPGNAFTTAPVAGNTVTVTANEQTSNTFTIT